MNTADTSGQFALEASGLAALKRQVREDPRSGLKQAAQQFEAVFLQMVLKAMRDATPQDAVFDNDQTRLYQGMFDQQLVQTLATRGATGLAAMIEKQLARTLPAKTSSPANGAGDGAATLPESRFGLDTLRGAGRQLVGEGTAQSASGGSTSGPKASASPREFVNRIWSGAQEAGRATNIPTHFIVAQAALESGWGRGELRFPDGRSAFNLFNVKAGRGWTGATVEATTTEYVDGVARKQAERFRAYDSYAEAFADYAALLKGSPRYVRVIGQQDATAFARALQQAGYATDPMYADKLARIIGSATLRDGMSG